MAKKARKKTAKSRSKAKTKSRRKAPPRKAAARKGARKSKVRKAAKRKPTRRRRKQEGVVDTLVDGVEAVQDSFEESAKMQDRIGTRWGTGEG